MTTAAWGLVASAKTATGAAAVSPFVGWIVGVAAAYVDSQWLMPRLAGRPRADALPPSMLDVEVGSNEAGAPRIWAIGSGVRVPTHVMWQSRKVRETTTTHRKAGMSGPSSLQREVTIDALLSLNDRKTVELTQLIGNGKLLMWESRNLVRLSTHEMTAAVSGANVVVTMSNTLVPSPTDVFKAGDIVRLYGWVSTAGPTINGHYWRISAISGHTSTPGTITLQVVDGQTVTGVAANGGNAFTPARIERVDDAMVYDPAAVTIIQLPLGPGLIYFDDNSARDPSQVFNVGDQVKLVNASAAVVGIVFTVVESLAGSHRLVIRSPGPTAPNPTPLVGGNQWLRVEFSSTLTSAAGLFEPGFIPKEHFHDGSEDQGEDPILVAEKGTGNVPAYRGLCYTAIDRGKA